MKKKHTRRKENERKNVINAKKTRQMYKEKNNFQMQKKNVDITIISEERICWPLESAFRIPKETLLVSESADRQILLRKRLLVIRMPYGFNDGNITIKILVAQQLNICLSNGPPWFNSQELV